MRLLLSILLLSLSSLTMSVGQGSDGHVKGEVWFRPFIEDENLFRNTHLPDCEIVFRSRTAEKKSAEKRVVTDKNGNYAVDLPPGNYGVTSTCKRTPDNWEYLPASRSDILVKPNSSSMINLMVLIKRIMRSPAGAGTTQPEYRKAELKNETLNAKTVKSSSSRSVLLRFTSRYSSKELAEYHGKRDYRQDAPVSVTYDVLAIYADSIAVEKPKMHVRAIGHVVVEDGKQRREGEEASVEFDADDPIATLKILEK